jgi:hypothetical protein
MLYERIIGFIKLNLAHEASPLKKQIKVMAEDRLALKQDHAKLGGRQSHREKFGTKWRTKPLPNCTYSYSSFFFFAGKTRYIKQQGLQEGQSLD